MPLRRCVKSLIWLPPKLTASALRGDSTPARQSRGESTPDPILNPISQLVARLKNLENQEAGKNNRRQPEQETTSS